MEIFCYVAHFKKIAQTAKIKNKKGHAVGKIGVGWIWEVLREGWIWPEYNLRDSQRINTLFI